MELLGVELPFHLPHSDRRPGEQRRLRTPRPCGARWRNRPAVVLLHGWNDHLNYQYRFPSLTHDLTRRGVNSVVFEMPYHFRRRPKKRGPHSDFISADVSHTVEAAAQALAEINAIVAWLHEQGLKRVALWGYSLGAWLAGLAACHIRPSHAPSCSLLSCGWIG